MTRISKLVSTPVLMLAVILDAVVLGNPVGDEPGWGKLTEPASLYDALTIEKLAVLPSDTEVEVQESIVDRSEVKWFRIRTVLRGKAVDGLILASKVSLLERNSRAVTSVESVGTFVEHSANAVVRMDETNDGVFGGFQTSDLTYDAHTGHWWSIGDQNCREETINGESHRGRFVYRINLEGGKAKIEPFQIWWKDVNEFGAVRSSFETPRYFRDGLTSIAGTGFIDFEGFSAIPNQRNAFLACTEGPEPWLVKMTFDEAKKKMHVVRTVRISRGGNHSEQGVDDTSHTDPKTWKDFINRRWEGLEVSPDGETIYLATEWSESQHKLYTLSMNEFENAHKENESLPKVSPKPLGITGLDGELADISFIKRQDRTYAVVLERNHPKLYVFDIADTGKVPTSIDLKLFAPGHVALDWVSPEGIAATPDGRVILINDPVGGHYHPLKAAIPQSEQLRHLIPMVFSLTTEDIVK